mgnify:CR=1 FL=1
MPFSYYDRLPPSKKAIYRESDRVPEIELGEATLLEEAVSALEDALESGTARRVQRASAGLCRRVTAHLGVEPVDVKVRARRPKSEESELHGLYEREEGRRALIQIWMRTASRRQVVAFRTFLRTLVHELVHHLDFSLLGLAETYHTEGFFRRESSLGRQLAPPPDVTEDQPESAEEEPPDEVVADVADTEGPRQLELPLE